MSAIMTTRQSKILIALLDSDTREQAAAAAGVSLATVDRALARPEFRAALKEARLQLIKDSVAALSQRKAEACHSTGS